MGHLKPTSQAQNDRWEITDKPIEDDVQIRVPIYDSKEVYFHPSVNRREITIGVVRLLDRDRHQGIPVTGQIRAGNCQIHLIPGGI